MALEQKQREDLVQAIAVNVAGMTLREIVREQKLVEFDQLRKHVSQDPAEAVVQIVEQIVAAYESAGRLHVLVEAIMKRCLFDDRCFEVIAPFLPLLNADAAAAAADQGLQAALRLRANTLRMPELRQFMASMESKLCLIACAGAGPLKLATGVLVGPDLVLTAYHVLAEHIKDGKRLPLGGVELAAIFDHCRAGEIDDLRRLPRSVLRVDFADDWLVSSCRHSEQIVSVRSADADQIKEMQANLDFALVRLREPVGLYSRDRAGGGELRSWCLLTPVDKLMQDDRIIIPQHPAGKEQRIDLGRYSEAASALDRSQTRVRYDTETANGSSGAPCFNQLWQFVGLHTAAFAPGGANVQYNQATRADLILRLINGKLPAAPAGEGAAVPDAAPRDAVPPDAALRDAAPRDAARGLQNGSARLAPTRLWNAAGFGEMPRPVLGRAPLLDWIVRASAPRPPRQDRIHVAKGNGSGCGKSFSAEILLAARRDSGDVFVSLGNGDQTPATADDLLRAIAYQLRISSALTAAMPARPAVDSRLLDSPDQGASPDAQKLLKWLGDELPRWFDQVLRAHRSYRADARSDAREIVELYRKLNKKPPDAELALAESPQEQLQQRERWQRCWIVLDNLQSSRLSSEATALLAGLIGVKWEETAVADELRRLRWLFLGDMPDFLLTQQVKPEILDPAAVGLGELLDTLAACSASVSLPLDDVTCGVFMEADLSDESNLPWLDNLATRLAALQKILTKVARVILRSRSSYQAGA